MPKTKIAPNAIKGILNRRFWEFFFLRLPGNMDAKKMSPNAIKGVLSTVPCTTVQFLALLSSFLALLSSLYFSFWVSCKQGTFLYFRQTILIHLYHYTYLFFQICNFFSIFWAHIHIWFSQASGHFLALLSISSCYCPVPRSTVHFPRATAQYAPTGQIWKLKKMGPKISSLKKNCFKSSSWNQTIPYFRFIKGPIPGPKLPLLSEFLCWMFVGPPLQVKGISLKPTRLRSLSAYFSIYCSSMPPE